MATTAVKPIPEGMRSLIPHIVCEGAAEAMDFYKKAFGAVELIRLPGPDGKLMHASMRIGDSVLMLVDANPAWGITSPKGTTGSSVTLHHYVENVDAVFAQAVAAGARPIMPPADMFWGDRYGQIEDPFGHRWSLATHKQDLSHEQILKASTAACCS